MNSDLKLNYAPKLVKANSIKPRITDWGRMSTLLDSHETGGACALFHASATPHIEVPNQNREIELLLVDSGHFELRTSSATYELSSGDFALIPNAASATLICVHCDGQDSGVFFNVLAGIGGNFQGDTPKIVRKNEGECLEAFGDATRVIVSSREVDNRFCLVEIKTPPLGGSALHIHEREDRAFFIREGRYEFCLGDARIHVAAGDTIFAPRGLAQNFRVVSAQSGVLVLLATPGGYDDFLREAARIFESGVPVEAELKELAARAGIRY